MIRSRVAKAITQHLIERYDGPIQLSQEDSGDMLTPPCAVVRIGSSEDMGMGQYEVYDMTVLVGVFHDYAETSAADASDAAEQIRSLLVDPEEMAATLGQHEFIMSSWQPTGMETNIDETGWQHVAVFRLIVSPTS